MPGNDLIAFGLFIGYFIAVGLPAVLLRLSLKVPSELMRKLLHLVAVFSIFPLVRFFSTWYMAVLAAFALVLLVYPLLAVLERTSFYQRIAVEREGGEFKKSLIVLELSLSILIAVFWGLLGIDWHYIVVAAVMAWGFGDAAAALVGKTFGRRRIRHRWIEGAKTFEGTLAMLVVAGLAIFGTLLIYAGRPWHVSLVVALLVAPVCSAVELFSHRGMDTLTVPLAAGCAMLPLMALVSILNV